MSLIYSLTFLMLSIACLGSVLTDWQVNSWVGVWRLYSAFSLLLVAVAYGGAGPRFLLKRDSGGRSIWGWILFGPYFLFYEISFAIYRWRSHEPAYVEVVPGIFLGRRLWSSECARCEWAHCEGVGVLDLAAESPEAVPLRRLAGYRSMPVLDATAPTEKQLRSAVEWMIASKASGPIYVHCVLGHGRSACVMVAYLLATGEVQTILEGERRLQSLRPKVGLNSDQREGLAVFERQAQVAAASRRS